MRPQNKEDGMRRTTKSAIALLTLICHVSLWAIETEVVDGMTWRYCFSADDGVLICAVAQDTRGSVTIPASLGGKAVRHIADGTFRHHHGITCVSIPDGVASIGYDAFAGCSNLTHVTIPATVTHVGRRAFASCNEALYDTATIPGVRLVGRWAVGAARELSGPLDLSGVRGVAEDAFFGCTNVTQVRFSNDAVTIGDKAFEKCASLTDVSIPASVTFIGRSAFYGCAKLKDFAVAAENPRYDVENGYLCDRQSGKKCQIGPYLYLSAEDEPCQATCYKPPMFEDFMCTTARLVGQGMVCAVCIAYVALYCFGSALSGKVK